MSQTIEHLMIKLILELKKAKLSVYHMVSNRLLSLIGLQRFPSCVFSDIPTCFGMSS